MEEKAKLTNNVTFGIVNGFNYVQVNKVKYFAGDYVILNSFDLQNNKPIKFVIEEVYLSKLPGSFVKFNSDHTGVYPLSAPKLSKDFGGFYYKKDEKKYVRQCNPRLYEADPNTEICDSYGNKGLMSNMVLVEGKLVVKDICTQIFYSDKQDDNAWILTKSLERISYFKCPINGKIYHANHGITTYNVRPLKENKDYFEVSSTTVSKGEEVKLTTVDLRILHPQYGREIVSLINPEVILESAPTKFMIGPKSGQIILVSELKKDGYRKYKNDLYFPEFKNLKSLKPGDMEFNSKWGLDSQTHLITEGLKYTFGVEIEMADCSFTPSMTKDYNIMVEKDGSIRNTRGEKYGPEVITGVLKGDNGFAHLQAICNELASKGEVNSSCGIHLHVGSADFNNTNVVLLYKLLKAVEEDVFNMLPKSRRNNEYCRKLPNLDFNFDECTTIMDMKIRVDNYYTELFTKAANSPPNDKYNKMTNHPKGAKVGYDHSNIRYCWSNFIPALFNTRNSIPPSYTIEFRCFNASTNFTKIKNWTKICMALVNFAENFHSDIMSNSVTLNGEVLPLTLKNVCAKVYPKSYRIINEFIDIRTETFRSDEEDIKNENELQTNLKLKQLI